jgi:ADP-heptose:LPS heptosyltransferase
LRCRNYDRVILLHRSMTRALLCSLAGIRERWGYGYRKRSWLLTQSLPVINKDSLHKQDYYLDMVRGLGVNVYDNNCRVFVSDDEKAWAQSLLSAYKQKNKKIVALNLLTNWSPKNWPLDHFAVFANQLKAKLSNLIFVLTSVASNQEFKDLALTDPYSFLDLTGKTSLRQLAAIYSMSDLIVSGDSGPLHLAAALGRRYIGLYGPTSAALTGVRSGSKGVIISNDNGCHTPCYIEPCEKKLQCMYGILPETVVDQAIKFL